MKPKPPKDTLKAARRGSRQAEIGMYGHPLAHHKVHRSKKQYDRKSAKARLKKGEPFFKAGCGQVFMGIPYLRSL